MTKRYCRILSFPVFDTVHPILDHANYLTLGITAALAYELPTKPFYIDHDLKNNYETGNVQRVDKNGTSLKYGATKKHQPSHAPIKYSNQKSDNYKSTYYTNYPASSIQPETMNVNRFYSRNGVRPIGPMNLLRPFDRPPQQYWSPSASHGTHWPATSNKMQYYLSYADKLFNDFNGLTAKIPKNPTWSQFANV